MRLLRCSLTLPNGSANKKKRTTKSNKQRMKIKMRRSRKIRVHQTGILFLFFDIFLILYTSQVFIILLLQNQPICCTYFDPLVLVFTTYSGITSGYLVLPACRGIISTTMKLALVLVFFDSSLYLCMYIIFLVLYTGPYIVAYLCTWKIFINFLV